MHVYNSFNRCIVHSVHFNIQIFKKCQPIPTVPFLQTTRECNKERPTFTKAMKQVEPKTTEKRVHNLKLE